jgi:hypothetical protein
MIESMVTKMTPMIKMIIDVVKFFVEQIILLYIIIIIYVKLSMGWV